jgi:DNA topoisomerase-2
MSEQSEPCIKKIDQNAIDSRTEWTKVAFKPDLARFNMTHLDDDIVALMTKRVYDIAGSNSALKVYLNGKRLPIRSFLDYVKLFIHSTEQAKIEDG